MVQCKSVKAREVFDWCYVGWNGCKHTVIIRGVFKMSGWR